ncbi:C69 family dipeptidase, partial [Bacteroides uniformis]
MKHTCTTFLAGKAATIDGSTLICRQEDYGNAF